MTGYEITKFMILQIALSFIFLAIFTEQVAALSIAIALFGLSISFMFWMERNGKGEIGKKLDGETYFLRYSTFFLYSAGVIVPYIYPLYAVPCFCLMIGVFISQTIKQVAILDMFPNIYKRKIFLFTGNILSLFLCIYALYIVVK